MEGLGLRGDRLVRGTRWGREHTLPSSILCLGPLECLLPFFPGCLLLSGAWGVP